MSPFTSYCKAFQLVAKSFPKLTPLASWSLFMFIVLCLLLLGEMRYPPVLRWLLSLWFGFVHCLVLFCVMDVGGAGFNNLVRLRQGIDELLLLFWDSKLCVHLLYLKLTFFVFWYCIGTIFGKISLLKWKRKWIPVIKEIIEGQGMNAQNWTPWFSDFSFFFFKSKCIFK